MRTNITDSNELAALRAIFVAAGFDLWFVGGCVRDVMSGKKPKDIDLATSATPEEQIKVYQRNKVRFAPTGLKHGTITVILDEPYEITSLRTETDHDGRWATVAFTRDIEEDLSRRDLTINAMALSFDDQLIDPFGGAADLAEGRVRFVGDAAERMREDYLRILRFFRFHARFAGDAPLDPEAVAAIEKTRAGLSGISVERVWSEMQRIVTGPVAVPTLRRMIDCALFEIIGMPYNTLFNISDARDLGIADAAAIMGVYLTPGQVDALAYDWKWSTVERDRARFMATERLRPWTPGRWKELLVDGEPAEWVADLVRLMRDDPKMVEQWPVPKFPVTGNDLKALGVKPGPEMGSLIRRLRQDWKDSDYQLNREVLLGRVENFQTIMRPVNDV